MGFAEDVRDGLTADEKWLLPKYLYDERGSALYEEIVELDEYYPPRVECDILRDHAHEMIAAAGPPKAILELGAGSGEKTRILIEALLKADGAVAYHPMDISEASIAFTEQVLGADYPDLTVDGFVGEHREALLEARDRVEPPRMFVFLGSSIGNLEPPEMVDLLATIRASMVDGESLLLGTDRVKSPDVLIPAYDDAEGVTAAFNRNLLARINQELGGRFDPETFEHRVAWNPDEQRIEISLVSTRDQSVRIDDLDLTVDFSEGEAIHTENSYKFTPERVADVAGEAGLAIERTWMDDREWFGLHLLKPEA